MTDASDSLSVVKRFYEAFARRDDATLLTLIADNAEWMAYGPPEIPFTGTWKGRAELEEYYDAVRSTLDVHVYEPREFIAESETVVVLGWVEATVKPTGKPFKSHFSHIYTVRDGRITSYRNFLDTATLLDALRS
ncbi:MAG: nuclear transport factor 2 family protein [Chloroflexi bacterium]|nr:nuclear transport factor 2 family protein [Chloroflexota bacterium]